MQPNKSMLKKKKKVLFQASENGTYLLQQTLHVYVTPDWDIVCLCFYKLGCCYWWDGFRLYMGVAANAVDLHSEKVITNRILFHSDYTKEEVSVGN